MNKRTRVAFLDTLLIVILILIIILKTEDYESAADDQPPPGSVIVQVLWPAGMDVDVDLWVEAPGDVPVGYSNKGAKYFNLLRDDLGQTADVTPINVEYAYTRGMPAGEYVVNLHLFSTKTYVGPVACVVEIRMLVGKSKYAMVFHREVTLRHAGEEITVQRFTLDEDSNLISHSLIPKALRSAGTGQSQPGGFGG